ncbi:MAG: HesA/MoeB/ThiF family protein [Candidatus Azobacteroides sp.]|nr:HesA/MoeB/ThiF family protein [Candidatus Azobacteroides sp.]
MERYERNIRIDGFGEEGQEKLKNARVLVVGAGGLGAPVLYYLAAAGIGTLGIIDYDVVDMTNLQRQIVHFYKDIGRAKVESAKEKIISLNPEITVCIYPEKLTEENACAIIREYDFVIECCDNYEAKFLVNDICVSLGKPYSHGAVLALRGEVMTYIPGTACYRCVFDSPPETGSRPSSKEAGILGAVAGVIGSIQATEAVKYFTGLGKLLTNRILIFDGSDMQFYSLNVEKRDSCVC